MSWVFANVVHFYSGVFLKQVLFQQPCIGNELAYLRAYVGSHGSIQRLLIFVQGQ